MTLSLDQFKRMASENHPDWSEETKQRWAESRYNSQVANDRILTREQWLEQWTIDAKASDFWWWISWWVDALSYNANKWSNDLMKAAEDVVSDEKANSWWWWKTLDQAVNIWADILWWAARALWSTPKFWKDLLSLPWSWEWWYDDWSKRVDELREQWVWRVWAWITALEEWSQSDYQNWENKHLFAQTVDQVINNPLVMLLTWWTSKAAGTWVTKLAKAWKFWTKLEKVAKWVWATANVVTDWSKAAKTTVWQTIKEWAKNVAKKAAESKVWQVLTKVKNSKFWQTIGKFWDEALNPLQPVIDLAWNPISKAYKWAKLWFKAWWVWWALRLWLWEALSTSIDTVWKFLSQPLSYRLPRVWSYDLWNRLLWEPSDAWLASIEEWNFNEEHWYALRNVLANKTEEELTAWYDKWNIPEDKRVTLDEAKEYANWMWESLVSWVIWWMRDVFSATDLMQYNQWYYEAVKSNDSWTLEQKEYTPRWRIKTSWWLSIDITDWTVTDSDWNKIDMTNLSQEQANDILTAISEINSWNYDGLILESEAKEADKSINITNLDQNTAAGQMIEWFAQQWLLSQSTVSNIMNWDKWMDWVSIVMNLNESSKQYITKIVQLYTPEEINKSPELQGKIMEHAWALQRWFDETARVISESSDEVYWSKKNVYRYNEAMTEALENLSQRDRDLINSNLYRQAIDYNNSLESGFDEIWMNAANSVVEKTDDWVVNKLLRDDSADIIDPLWLAWLWNTAVNPNVVWAATMWWDVKSAVASNAAYLIDTAVVNFVNNNLIEWYLWKLVNNKMNKIVPARILADKRYNFAKWALSEMASEPLENFLDAITMQDDASTNYDFMPWLMIGMLQGWFAWYASSRSNYSTIHDYFSDPNNRKDILSRMWINLDLIPDWQKKATAMALLNQAFDNVIWVMEQAYANSNYWVENLAQSLAITLINNDLADYSTSILDQAQQKISEINRANWWQWTDEQVADVFWTRENLENFFAGKQFSFAEPFIQTLNQANAERFSGIQSRAIALAATASSIKWNSLQEVFDKMAPKVWIDWLSIKPALTKKQKSAAITKFETLEPWTPATQQYVLYRLIDWANVEHQTIADMLWIWRWSEAWDDKKWDFKNTIKRKTANWKEERISIRDYIFEKLSNENSWLTQEQKSFIANMLLRTNSLWINSYFTGSWALSRLGKDFFNSVMPALEWREAAFNWFNFVNADQIKKISKSQASKKKALAQRWNQTNKVVNRITLWWKSIVVWEKMENPDLDAQIWWLTLEDGTPYTLRMLQNDWKKEFTEDWVTYTLTFANWVFNIKRSTWSQQVQTSSRKDEIKELLKLWDKNKINAALDEKIKYYKDQYEAHTQTDARWNASSDRANFEYYETLKKYINMPKEKLEEEIHNIEMSISALKKEYFDSNKKINNWDKQEAYKKEIEIIKDIIASIDDDWTPPPAAPAVLRWSLWMTSSIDAKTPKEVKQTCWDTRESWASIDPEDLIELVEKSNDLKSKLPIQERKQANVNIKLAEDADEEMWVLQEKIDILWTDLRDADDALINSDAAKATYQEIEFTDKDWNVRIYYAVPQLNLAINPESNWEDESLWDADIFNSFVLIEKNSWERIIKHTNTIFRWPEEHLTYFGNNYIYEVVDAQWNPVDENRVINFTRHPNYESWKNEWRMATCIQLNRLSYADRQRAYKSWKVFLVQNVQENYNWEEKNFIRKATIPATDKENWLPVTMDYDYRWIYTTCDMILNKDVSEVKVWNLKITVAGKEFDRENLRSQTEFRWEAPEQTPENLQTTNEYLVRYDPTRWDDFPKATTKQERAAVQNLKDVDNSTEDLYEQASEEATSDTEDPNVSEEESINNYNLSKNPGIYDTAKAKIALINADATGFPISDYIDLDALAHIVYYVNRDWITPKYQDYINNCIKDSFKEMSVEDLFRLHTRLENIYHSVRHWRDYDGTNYPKWLFDTLKTLIDIIEARRSDDFDKLLLINNTTTYNWKDPKEFINEVIPTWYCPIEINISTQDWKIVNVNYWLWNSSYAGSKWDWNIHSHPSWSFFSASDIKSAVRKQRKTIWLILPWSVIVNFNVDGKLLDAAWFDSNTLDIDSENWYFENGALWWWVLCSANLALWQWNFDQQQWWEFDSIVNEYKTWYNDPNRTEDQLADIIEKAKKKSTQVIKNIWVSFKDEINNKSSDIYVLWRAIAFKNSALNDQINDTVSSSNVSDDIYNLTEAEKDTITEFLDGHYSATDNPYLSNNAAIDEDSKTISVERPKNARITKSHFANPWSTSWENWTIKASSEKEAVDNYYKWLSWTDFQDVEPNRRQWILEQILSWNLKWYKIIEKKSDANYDENDPLSLHYKWFWYEYDYNLWWQRPYSTWMILWILINNVNYLHAARTLKIDYYWIGRKLEANARRFWPLDKVMNKKALAFDSAALARSNKIIWYWYNTYWIYTALLYWYAQTNPHAMNTHDYRNTDVVFVTIPTYKKLNKDVDANWFKKQVDWFIENTYKTLDEAIAAWSSFTLWTMEWKYESAIKAKLKAAWYVENRLVWTKKWQAEPDLPRDIIETANDPVVTKWEKSILDDIVSNMDDVMNEIDIISNSETVDSFSNLLDDTQKTQIIKDMNSIWLSLETLDAETVWDIVLAYVNWNWLDDVIQVIAGKVRTSTIDNYLKTMLIENWVLDKAWTYWWLTVDWAIALNAVANYINNKKYWDNLTDDEYTSLSLELYNTLNENREKYWIKEEDVSTFFMHYMNAQVFRKADNVSIEEFIKKKKAQMKFALQNYSELNVNNESPTEWSVYQAVSLTDWLYNNEAKIAKAMTYDFVTNQLKLNFDKVSSDLKNHIYLTILDQIKNDWAVMLKDPSKDNIMRWMAVIPQLVWMDEAVRQKMADEMYKNWIIWWTVYNYLAKINPATTVLNKTWDITWWVISSLIVRQIDELLWVDDDRVINSSNMEKINLFMDIYRYYATWHTSYEKLVNLLRKRWTWRNDNVLNMVNILAKDMEMSNNLQFDPTTIDEVLKDTEKYNWPDNPYNVFIKDIKWTQNENDAIFNALMKLYYWDRTSFFVVMNYAPTNVKVRIADYMRNENNKEHWSNIALSMVTWFLTTAKNKEIIQNLISEKISKNYVWNNASEEDMINAVSTSVIKNFNDDTIIVLPELTSKLFKELWIPWLDLTKWTILYKWPEWNSYLPEWWTNFEWKDTFPIKIVSSLDWVTADVNVIVPDWIKLPSTAERKWFNIVRSKVWFNNWLMVYQPKTAYTNKWIIWNVISSLGKLWLNVSETDWFKFSEDQEAYLQQRIMMKDLYRHIYNDIIVPWLDWWVSPISASKFRKLITTKSMKKVDMNLLKAVIASKSIDDKYNWAIILINQVTNWKLALSTDIQWTNKSIDFDWAYEAFKNSVLSLLDENDDQYEYKYNILNSFFASYVWTLMRIADPNADLVENSDAATWWISTAWFSYLINNQQSALHLLKELFKDNNIVLSKWALISPDSPSVWNISDAVATAWNTWVNDMAEYISGQKIAWKEIVDWGVYKKLWEVNKRLNAIYKWADLRSPNEEDYLNAVKNHLLWLIWWESITIDDWSLNLKNLVSEEKEELVDDVYSDSSSVDYWDIDGKDAEVIATIFNQVIYNNLYAIWTRDITYDDSWENKFVSENLLSYISDNSWTAIIKNQSVEQSKEWVVVEDAKQYDTYKSLISIWDALAIQTLISTTKSNTDELNKLLDYILPLPEWIEPSDPVATLFRKTKEAIIRDPSSWATQIFKLIDNDNVNFDVEKIKLITKRVPNNDKIAWLASQIAEAVVRYNSQPLSESEMDEAKKDLLKFFKDKNWNQITPSDDQIRVANAIFDLYQSKEREDKQILAVPWYAWVWKSTTIVAALSAIHDLWSVKFNDVERINAGQQTMISDNIRFKWADYRTITSWKNNPDEVHHIVVEVDGKQTTIEFTWKDIITHDQLKQEYEKDPVAFFNKYKWWFSNIWNDEFLEHYFELWKYDRWERSQWRILFTNIKSAEWKTPSVSTKIGWMWSQAWWIKAKIVMDDVLMLTKNNSTVQSLKDLVWDKWLAAINIATMDSQLTTLSPSGFWLYWFWSSWIIKPDSDIKDKLILIDESQNVDSDTLEAILKLWEKNNIVLLWDFHQRTQSDIFQWLVEDENVRTIELSKIFRWTQNMQDTSKLNALGQKYIAESWFVAIIPSDSPDYVEYTNPEDTFDLPGTTMYAVRTNPRWKEINEAYFNWATSNMTSFVESTVEWYANRTKQNADYWDVTIALATNFDTAWEKLTKQVAWNKYVNHDLSASVNDIVNSIYNQIISKWLPTENIKINMAGNGLYTVSKQFTQQQINDKVTAVIKWLQKKWITIKEIRSGWQTWVDEAWIVAAKNLWIKSSVVAPKWWKFRTVEWKDISSEKEFKSRFASAKPIPTMIVNALQLKDWKYSVNKWILNKRNHEWINLSEFTKDWDIYKKVSENNVTIFVPVLPDTNQSTVSKYVEDARKKYNWKNIEVITTAFAVTTAKESWKTVDNIIIDEWITNPEYDIYALPNTKDAYDSMTRWDKKVYYPKSATNLLFMSMQQIHDLVTNNNKNITLSAKKNKSMTTVKDIKIPRFYANDQWRKARDILADIKYIVWEKFAEDLNTLNNAVDNYVAQENIYNKDLLTMDIASWARDYWAKYAVWVWRMINWLKREIAYFWDRNYEAIRDMIKDPKSAAKFSKINWWVYWQQISRPNIPDWALFTSFQSANKRISYETLTKSESALKNWDRWMFLVPDKIIKNWKEMWYAKPAKITWEVKNIPWILSNTWTRPTEKDYWLKYSPKTFQELSALTNAEEAAEAWNENLQDMMDKTPDLTDTEIQEWLTMSEYTQMHPLAVINYPDAMEKVDEETTCWF